MKSKSLHKYVLICPVVLTLLIAPLTGYGSSVVKKRPLDKNLDTELTYLLSFVGPQAVDAGSFSANRISDLIEFILKPKDQAVLYHAAKINGAASAYHEVDINGGIEKVLRVAYNPEIPALVTRPSVLRLSHWKKINAPGNRLPKLWKLISDLHKPRIFTGIEHIANAPDYRTGAYFEYDLYRTLILMKHNARVVLISLSKQKGVSGAGKKGIVIGAYENWDYLYTDITGSNIAGFGWVKPYMYDSHSVSFYCEMEAQNPTVRFATFKWLSGGVLSFNFVSMLEIYKGMARFDAEFKHILENPGIIDQTGIAKTCKTIQELSDKDLKQIQIARNYLVKLEQRSTASGLMPDKQAAALFANQQYLNTLGREEMQAFIILEDMKQILNASNNPRPVHHAATLEASGESKNRRFRTCWQRSVRMIGLNLKGGNYENKFGEEIR